ncbi:Signal peptidase I, Serine peptidase, MEROPS family S26A [metagenome]|uniref:signal peptidase I n=1 Tax=metagenome TaxID=256318 RepID=A0A2P2CCU9_9ZZZZ
MTIEDRDTETEESSGRGSRSSRFHLRVWQESVLMLGIALVLAVVVKSFFVQAFYIPSESMEPGLVDNDRILVEKWSYWGSGEPQRGDVVVFQDPGGWLPDDDKEPGFLRAALEKVGLYPATGHLVKRVIGVAGDTIVCCDDQGRISVNGIPLDEPYLKNDASCNGPMIGCQWSAGPVPPHRIFVMGDHRDDSGDSTVHMCRENETECVKGHEYVRVHRVVGKVFVLAWPLGHAGWIKRPATFADLDGG